MRNVEGKAVVDIRGTQHTVGAYSVLTEGRAGATGPVLRVMSYSGEHGAL